jgi:hypothetical protein
MIFYITDNPVSHTVGAAFEKSGAEVRHIREFQIMECDTEYAGAPFIFYGILRGAGAAMKACGFSRPWKPDFFYVDNGYFDAVYRDQKTGWKEMNGSYRVVKNELMDVYIGKPRTEERRPLKILALPPTPYSANMQDTTPEDWFADLKKLREITGDHIDVRNKDEKRPLAEHLQCYDGVISFNSMATMEASRLGKACWDFHGIFRNADKFTTEIPYFDYESLTDFYSTKQFTLEEIAEGNWK